MIAVNHSHPWLRRHVGATVSQINGCILKTQMTTTATTASRQEIMVAVKENSVISLQGEAFAESIADKSLAFYTVVMRSSMQR